MSSRVDDVCAQIVESGLHADMLANLAWETLSADSLNDPKAGTRRDFVEAHLATLHNVVRKTQTGRNALRQCRALDVLSKYRSCSEFPVRNLFIYLLIYLTLLVGRQEGHPACKN